MSENIKRLRTDADMTQAKLADLVGVTRATVTQWETGWSQTRMGALEKIADVFGVSMSMLVADGNQLPSNALPVRGMPMAKVPLVGSTHAGRPEMPDCPDEFPLVDVPQFLIERDPGSYGLSVDGDCMDEVCPPGMVAVVQPSVPERSGDVVVATIDGAESIMRRMTVINGDLILSPESHCKEYENRCAARDATHLITWLRSRRASRARR